MIGPAASEKAADIGRKLHTSARCPGRTRLGQWWQSGPGLRSTVRRVDRRVGRRRRYRVAAAIANAMTAGDRWHERQRTHQPASSTLSCFTAARTGADGCSAYAGDDVVMVRLLRIIPSDAVLERRALGVVAALCRNQTRA